MTPTVRVLSAIVSLEVVLFGLTSCSSETAGSPSKLAITQVPSPAATHASTTVGPIGSPSSPTAPTITLPRVGTTHPARSTRVGTVTVIASDLNGFRLTATVTFHRAIAMGQMQADLGSCAVKDSGAEAASAAIPVEIHAVDATPNDFHVPDGEVIALRSPGLFEPLVGNSTSDFVPSFCEALGAAPGTTAAGYLVATDFRTPTDPSGDFANLGPLHLYSPKWQASNPLGDFPDLAITSCAGTGVVHGQIEKQSGPAQIPAICVLTFT